MLFSAVSQHRPPRGLILRSDRGSQYCAQDYQRLIRQFGMQCSMSRRGNCNDNAPMESFWGRLKNELVPGVDRATDRHSVVARSLPLRRTRFPNPDLAMRESAQTGDAVTPSVGKSAHYHFVVTPAIHRSVVKEIRPLPSRARRMRPEESTWIH